MIFLTTDFTDKRGCAAAGKPWKSFRTGTSALTGQLTLISPATRKPLPPRSGRTHAGSQKPLPPEPPQELAIEEIYDNEAGLVIFTYSLKRDGVVDYVTGRKVLNWRVNDYGHGVYDIERFPVFYWYNHALWRDMDADGLNGNEVLYMENTGFDRLRYK